MSNQSLPLDVDAAAEPDDVVLRRLARALDYAEGFWLGFAKCNSPAQRRRLSADARALLEALKIHVLEIELVERIDDLLPVIRENLSRLRDGHTGEGDESNSSPRPDKVAVFVYGLEHSIPSREAYPPVLSSLNLNRELFRQQLPHPLVLWLPDYALTALARKAPDLWAWRSGLYEFAPARELSDRSLESVRKEALHVTESLPEQAKRERLTMLKGLLDDYRELGDGPREQEARASILDQLGSLHYMLGELFEARQAYEEARLTWRKLEVESGEAAELHNLAMIAWEVGEIDEARRLYTESMEIDKRLGDQSGIAASLHELGKLAQGEGEFDEARRLSTESLEIDKNLGNQLGIARSLHNLGMIAQSAGELDEARRLYAESLDIKKKLDDQSGIAKTLHNLGMIALDVGELDEARRLYAESMEIKKRLGDQLGIAFTLWQLGRLAQVDGNLSEAVPLYQEALSIFERLKSPRAEGAREDLERVERALSSS